MNDGKKPQLRQQNPGEDKRKLINRAAVAGLFAATGLISLFFWWRGNVIRETPPKTNNSSSASSSSSASQEGNGANQKADASQRLREQRLAEELKEITATAAGRYAVYVYRLEDKSGYGFRETERMPAASIMKVPVMAAAWREIAAGRLKQTDIYTLDEADRSTGSGPLQFKPAGSEYTVEELLTYLGKNSDNTAWVMFNRRLGKAAMSGIMTEMGMADSAYGDGIITAADVARMFEFIYYGRAGGSLSRDAIFAYLTDSIYEDRIPAGTAGTGCRMLAHKVGTDAGVWADAGILEEGNGGKPIIVVILNQGVDRTEAGQMVPELARRICRFEENRQETR